MYSPYILSTLLTIASIYFFNKHLGFKRSDEPIERYYVSFSKEIGLVKNKQNSFIFINTALGNFGVWEKSVFADGG
jgi:hypothetical protein